MVGGAVYKKVTARIVARPMVSRDCGSPWRSGGRRGALLWTGLRENRGGRKLCHLLRGRKQNITSSRTSSGRGRATHFTAVRCARAPCKLPT